MGKSAAVLSMSSVSSFVIISLALLCVFILLKNKKKSGMITVPTTLQETKKKKKGKKSTTTTATTSSTYDGPFNNLLLTGTVLDGPMSSIDEAKNACSKNASCVIVEKQANQYIIKSFDIPEECKTMKKRCADGFLDGNETWLKTGAYNPEAIKKLTDSLNAAKEYGGCKASCIAGLVFDGLGTVFFGLPEGKALVTALDAGLDAAILVGSVVTSKLNAKIETKNSARAMDGSIFSNYPKSLMRGLATITNAVSNVNPLTRGAGTYPACPGTKTPTPEDCKTPTYSSCSTCVWSAMYAPVNDYFAVPKGQYNYSPTFDEFLMKSAGLSAKVYNQ